MLAGGIAEWPANGMIGKQKLGKLRHGETIHTGDETYITHSIVFMISRCSHNINNVY